MCAVVTLKHHSRPYSHSHISPSRHPDQVLDIFNYLGLSNVIMRNVESRDQMDRVITFVGMFLVTLLLLLLWWFFK